MNKPKESKLKKILKSYLPIVGSILIIVAVILVINLVIMPWLKYSDADTALEQGEYKKAIELFEKLGNYKDSAKRKEEAEKLLNYTSSVYTDENGDEIKIDDEENSYLRAKSLLKNGKYASAAPILRALGNYKDSAELLEPIKFYGLSIGTEIKMGKYEQDNVTSNGSEDITWVVVENESDSVVLMSKYILDFKTFNSGNSSVWGSSSLRTFLNGDFYNSAFSKDEKSIIFEKETETPANTEYASDDEPKSSKDKVFIPSVEQIKEYTAKNTELKSAQGTEYAKAKGLYEYEYELKGTKYTGSWYWLRNIGVMDGYATVCHSNGYVGYDGQRCTVSLGVRPCIRIKLETPAE